MRFSKSTKDVSLDSFGCIHVATRYRANYKVTKQVKLCLSSGLTKATM